MRTLIVRSFYFTFIVANERIRRALQQTISVCAFTKLTEQHGILKTN